MAVNFAIDGSPLTHQPSRVELQPAEAAMDRVVDGGHVAHVRNDGAVVRVTWGVDGAKAEALTELRNARAGTIAHSISFTDPSNATHNLDVLWRSEPPFAVRLPEDFDQITIVFEERPS